MRGTAGDDDAQPGARVIHIVFLLANTIARRLSRKAKDLVCMRQLAQCGYCGRLLCDAFEVDHLNEDRTDDREENLVATCALCHAIKSRHVRLAREWSDMRSTLATHLSSFRDRCTRGAKWDALPSWLQQRVTRNDFRLYVLALRPAPPSTVDWHRFRYEGAPKPHYRTG